MVYPIGEAVVKKDKDNKQADHIGTQSENSLLEVCEG
jgi:hypothetical protein